MGVARNGGGGLVEKCVIAVEHRLVEEWLCGAVVEADVYVVLFHFVAEKVEVGVERRGGGTVVVFHELPAMAFQVAVGIPQELGNQVQAKLVEVDSPARRAARLLEDALDVILGEGLHVGL